MSRLAQITVVDAAWGLWGFLWRGTLWAICMMIAAHFLELEWSNRLLALCILSGFIDSIIYMGQGRGR